MKILSWNVNGINAWKRKKGLQHISNLNPNIVCLQETKCNKECIFLDGYIAFWNFGHRKGYSGTVIFTKTKPIQLHFDNDPEGRIICLEYDNFILINTYFPNSQRLLDRLDYRLEFDKNITNIITKLHKPIIMCGDCNISQTEKDIAEPKKHKNHPGYTQIERTSFEKILTSCKLTDVYRYIYPNEKKYTFWSYLGKNKERNIGYRCDLFCIGNKLKDNIVDIHTYTDIRCSDHCPVLLDINI